MAALLSSGWGVYRSSLLLGHVRRLPKAYQSTTPPPSANNHPRLSLTAGTSSIRSVSRSLWQPSQQAAAPKVALHQQHPRWRHMPRQHMCHHVPWIYSTTGMRPLAARFTSGASPGNPKDLDDATDGTAHQQQQQQPLLSGQAQGQQPDQQEHAAAESAKADLLSKAWYFLQGASTVFLLPYLNIYLSQRGLSPAQIGVLAALRPWLSAPVGMAASAAADRYKGHTSLLVVAVTLMTLARAGLPAVEGLVALGALLVASELMAASVSMLGDAVVLSSCKHDGDFGRQRLWASVGWGGCSLIAGSLISYAGINSIFPVYAAMSLPLTLIASRLRHKQHAEPPAGAAVVAVMDPAAAVDAPLQQEPALQQAGDSRGAAEELLRPGMWQQQQQGPQQQHRGTQQQQQQQGPQQQHQGTQQQQQQATQQQQQQQQHSSTPPPRLQAVLRDPSTLLFLARCVLMGFGGGVIGSYEFLYLNQLGAPETLIGVALLVSCCTEVPAFRYQGALLQRLPVPTILNIVLLAISLRLACYAALPAAGSLWAVLPVELLHGITFACGFGAAAVHVKRIAPPGLAATLQGVFQATYLGAGVGLGALVGGGIMEMAGGQVLFGAASLLVLAGWVGTCVAEALISGGPRGANRPGAPQKYKVA